jgi:thioesterase domain-containing protein
LFKYPTVAQLYDYTQQGNAEKSWKSLVPIKTGGKKLPVYIVHGDGLNVLNISDLAAHMHPEQPVYGLQPKGLNACDEPFDNMQEIARHYVQEILEQNPSGPYALAGYSFGGFVAIEMRRQLVALGKQVKLLAIFDTNTDSLEYAKHLRLTLSRKMKRQLPKFLFITKSILKEPKKTASYQLNLISRKMSHLIHPHQPAVMERPENFSPHWEKIYENHTIAFRNYDMEPFDGELHLFKAKQRTFFVDDMDFLGWKKYANKGVLVHDVTGDHKTMLEMPHAIEFASQLQDVLDFISRQ